MKINSNEGAELLAQAIVEHAVVDYQNALRHISEYEKAFSERPDAGVRLKLSIARDMKTGCEKFFHSEFCFSLTGVSGDQLIKMIHKKGKRAKKKNG